MISNTNLLGNETDQSSTYDDIWRRAECAIVWLREAVQKDWRIQDAFDRANNDLQRLPMTSDEFALATLRLHNALHYCGCNENGAAVFEINLLYGSIRGEAKHA